MKSAEYLRIEEKDKGKEWLKWGPYLSERQWGTVREDYSPHGDAWSYFPHEHARSRTYRWGEDGLAGISDTYCNLCFAMCLWNGKDPILKERLFGLNGHEGNHGEDVKELYYYLENTPTHSYMKYLYKYPQQEYPYIEVRDTNQGRSREEDEFEILDTGIFGEDRFFDVTVEYAKNDPEDMLIKVTITNHGPETAPIHLLPTLWIRNFWSFKIKEHRPVIKRSGKQTDHVVIAHHRVGNYWLYHDTPNRMLFTENETNDEKIYGRKNDHPYKKDLFHDAVTQGNYKLATARKHGTKYAPEYRLEIPPGGSTTVRLRLSNKMMADPLGKEFEAVFKERVEECTEFYEAQCGSEDKETSRIQRQALAGLLWSKQYYNYEIEPWLKGDPTSPPPPAERLTGRNHKWKTLRNHDVLTMPDAWEYPWYAAWDSAFHLVTLALIDPQSAKKELLLFTKEWYMAPNGQIPAYEWNFSDVNPPVQAWAALRIYKMEKERTGKGDLHFLKRMFNKLALNFTWWVNRLDAHEKNVFQGGFLGLDNIGVFDRSHGVPGGGVLEQVDGTSWMAKYCLNMLEMSLEISMQDPSFEDMATKYFGHFVFIAEAMNRMSQEYQGTWDEEEDFFYDKLVHPDGSFTPIKVRAISGMLSLTAVLCISKETLEKLPRFKRSVQWFREYRKDWLKYPVIQDFQEGHDLLLSLVPRDRQRILLRALLDTDEFLSAYGIRSLSKRHTKPYTLTIDGSQYSIRYEPGESTTPLFGGNSNWRGPVWFPMNYLFIQALREYDSYYRGSMKMEFPTGGGQVYSLLEISNAIGERLIDIFRQDEKQERPVHAQHKEFYKVPGHQDLILFYEYFHGDNGRGVGSSHQTGWTALVANLIAELYPHAN